MSQKSCRVWLSGCILPSWNGVSFVQFHRPRRMYIAKGSETYFLSYRLYHIIWILNCKFWILRYLLQPIISGDQFQLWSMWCWSVRIGRIVWTSMFTSLSFNASYNRWWIYDWYKLVNFQAYFQMHFKMGFTPRLQTQINMAMSLLGQRRP